MSYRFALINDYGAPTTDLVFLGSSDVFQVVFPAGPASVILGRFDKSGVLIDLWHTGKTACMGDIIDISPILTIGQLFTKQTYEYRDYEYRDEEHWPDDEFLFG